MCCANALCSRVRVGGSRLLAFWCYNTIKKLIHIWTHERAGLVVAENNVLTTVITGGIINGTKVAPYVELKPCLIISAKPEA